jgi:hypothetical protein
MITEVDKYRGWDISFDTDKETFTAYSNVYDREIVKMSYASVKKHIDDFIKDNQNFKPFYIVRAINIYTNLKRARVVGLRKDGAFVAEKMDGEKFQVSKYDESSYVLETSEYEEINSEYERLNLIAQQARKNVDDYIKTKTFKSLADYKKELLNTKD